MMNIVILKKKLFPGLRNFTSHDQLFLLRLVEKIFFFVNKKLNVNGENWHF